MPAYKDKSTGKWFCKFYYADWQGNNRQKWKQQELVSNLEHLAATIDVTPTPELPTGNPLLETIGISYDGNMASDSVTLDKAYADAGLPYGPMPKETAPGKVIPMPQRKII